MLIITNPVNIYGKKVITDIGTRSGAHTLDSFSYGLGLFKTVQDYWKDDEDIPTNIDMHLEEQPDFDADVTRSSLNEEEYNDETDDVEEQTFDAYDPSKDPIDFKKYNRRLEDIPNKYLEQYLGMVMFNICRRDGSFRNYKKRHKIQACLTNSNDDGDDFTELADLIVEEPDEWSLGQKQTAQRNLSYVVKRLHNMSCYCKVHILSYIAAYQRAQQFIQDNHGSGGVRTITANLVIDKGVWLCDKNGNPTKRVYSENKNKHARAMFNWIMGGTCEYSSYYQDYLDFVHYCDVLDIDIVHDDMTKYTSDFIEKLIVTTVTPNKQYDKKVYSALYNNVGNPAMSIQEPTPDMEKLIQNTTAAFKQLLSTNNDMRFAMYKFGVSDRELYMSYASMIYGYYSFSINHIAPDPAKYSWSYGYLHYNGDLVILPAGWLGDKDRTSMDGIYCIISELGYILAMVPGFDVYYLTINNAYENVKQTRECNYDYKKVDWIRTSP